MRIYGRYLIGQVVRPMLAILLIALGALLAERMLRVVDIVVGWHGSFAVLVEMMGYLVPHYLILALPAAFFVAMLLSLSRLARDGELDALTGAGLGLHRIIQPLMGLGLVLFVVNLAILSHLQPYSRYAYRAALFALTNVSFQALLRERAFVTLGRTTYTADELSPDHRDLGGLFLYSERDNGDTLTLTAKDGTIVDAAGNQPLMLRLADGVQQYVPAPQAARPGEAPVSTAPATLRFRTFTSDLQGAEPKPFRPRGEDERELTLPELWAAYGGPLPGIEAQEIAAELHGRLVRALATLALPLVAVPLAIGRRRAQRSYGIVVGLALLLLLNQLVQFGESLADDGRIPAGLGLWTPLLAFALIGAALVGRRGWHVASGAGTPRLDAWVEAVVSAVQRRGLGARAAE